jgi:hypothetical protein
MKAIAKQIKLQYTEDGTPLLILAINGNKYELQKDVVELKNTIANGKQLSVEIKQYRQKRSLDANSYAWVLISKIAEVWSPPSTKDDIYIEMLKRYGQREPQLISVVADAADIIYRATKNHCCEVGESELNGKLFKHLAILIGSSQYDTKQMSILIDGIVSEAKELDIETMTPGEIALLKSEWGK